MQHKWQESNIMEDKVDWKDDKISHKGMKRKISELEARIVELEKRPQAKFCELCGHTTFQKFVPFRWEKKGKEFEICPKCARLESKQVERAKQEKDWKGFGSVKME